jgi:pimeloyl-ACP methyl ester carboxylesterase
MRLMTITEPKVKIPIILDMIYPEPWLAEKADNDAAGRTNREVQFEVIRIWFCPLKIPFTDGDIYLQTYQRRIEITKPQTLMGSISQMAAGLTHSVSPARLHAISLSVPKVVIVTGDEDHLVDPRNSAYLKKHMPDAEYIVFGATGHAIQAQRKERFNALLERVFKGGRERADAVR